VVVSRVRSEHPLSERIDGRPDRVEVVGGAATGLDRQELEGPGDRVVQGGEVLERRLALGLGHQVEVERRELEPAADAAAGSEPILLDRSSRPGGRRGDGCRRPVAEDREGRPHGAATGLRAR
jgi:hypothetical protein